MPFDSSRNNVGDLSDTVRSIATADFDNDGDEDIVSVCEDGEDYEIVVWQNDGTPFTGTWAQNDVGASESNVYSVAVADLDNDGYMDIVSENRTDLSPDGSEISVWQNDGTPFTGTWTKNAVCQDS